MHPQAASRNELPAQSRPISLRACARAAPRVHCITNAVAQNFTANVLLAAGAIPSMTLSAEEIGAFVAGAQSASGQSRHLRSRAPQATAIARRNGCQARRCPGCSIRCSSIARRRAPPSRASSSAASRRSIRLNRAEFSALAGACADARCALRHMRAPTGSSSGSPGETDLVTDGERTRRRSPMAIR